MVLIIVTCLLYNIIAVLGYIILGGDKVGVNPDIKKRWLLFNATIGFIWVPIVLLRGLIWILWNFPKILKLAWKVYKKYPW